MIFVDITTSHREQGRLPHGIRRVERCIVAALAAMDRPDVGFCRYDRRRHAMIAVPREEALRIVSAAPAAEARRAARPAWRDALPLRAGRQAEMWLRLNLRDRMWRPVKAALRPGRNDLPRGSTLVLPSGIGGAPERALLRRLRRRDGIRLAALCHDVLAVKQSLDFRPDMLIAAHRPASDFMLRHCDLVLCNSRHTAATLARYVAERGLPVPPVEVLPLGHDIGVGARAAPPLPEGLEAGRFVLAVGGLEPRKNHRVVIEAWTRLARAGRTDLPLLVIAGSIGRAGAPLARAIAGDSVASRLVRLLPSVDDTLLRRLYAECCFTVFPSLYEGYGLPIGESLFFGKACIAANTTAMPEASQGLAIHLDPTDVEAWTRAIETLLDDSGRRALEAEVRARFRRITWGDTAAALLGFLEPPGAHGRRDGPAPEDGSAPAAEPAPRSSAPIVSAL
jgi:glycosyltransferase involved in cell wall biosynthesis